VTNRPQNGQAEAVQILDIDVWRILVALLAMYLFFKVSFKVLRGLAQPIEPPPEPGQLRKVKLTYRCGVCGAEVRMTAAATDDPEPPRHCLEDMDLVAPVID
jgi:hypothetical protein